MAARLALTGAPLDGLPPATLEELAGTVGNSAMLELVSSMAPEPGFAEPFALSWGMAAARGVEPFEVTADAPGLVDPVGLANSPGTLAPASPAAFAG